MMAKFEPQMAATIAEIIALNVCKLRELRIQTSKLYLYVFDWR